jgi:SecD-like export protein
MKEIRELLQDADPLRRELPVPTDQRDLRRRAVLSAASRSYAGEELRSRFAVFSAVALVVIVAVFLGARIWFVSEAQAAVRFEIKLAEESPGPGLREVKAPGSDRSVYLHDEAIATNSDIATARVVDGGDASHYAIAVEFNTAAAQKIRSATEKHVGRPLAILLDGQVALVLKVRTPIGGSAMITGDFTKAQAERIANGITMQ